MQYPGKAPPPYVESHRLPPEATARHGLQPIDPATFTALRAIGQRKAPRDRVLTTLAIVGTLVLHLLIIMLVSYEMQPRPYLGYAPVDDKAEIMEVRFIEPTPPPPPQANVPPPPPVSEPPPKVRSPEATRPEPPRPKKELPKDEPPAENEAPAPPAPALQLYGKDGSINAGKPAPSTGATTQADFVSHKPTDDAGVMVHKGPVTYKETRFEKDWAPRDENIANAGMRKVLENTMLKKEVNIGGQRINCATVLFILPVGCRGQDPSKPPPKSADGRLNMAPSHPLADGPDVVKPPSEAECIAAFRADKPLPQGCASDVPLKAIELEKAEQERRTGH
ncbi:hypothetical protein FIV34_16815 [Luteibacter pinisoli]|uniref:Energy transducer TonB n=1 Tax=Luteibacter pinisoli TaxID=2589080 RepID=A0A4Y5Z884_9GAMM|nr:hypothetical protein [Luteibacter pinisoli]QDE40749.1 hypothetical protein FIV34_16815 [Luteibacter pinisoli]